MKNKKIILMSSLVLIAGLVIYINHKTKNNPNLGLTTEPAEQKLPVPAGFSLTDRNAYKAPKGDIKYRIVAKPVLSTDSATNWKMYTSIEYGFSFTYPPSNVLTSTESLGFQLPSTKAFKGSRDNFEIDLTKKNASADVLYMNYADFKVATTTQLTAQTTFSNNNLTFTKQIYSDPAANSQNNEIIVYKTEHQNKSFIWYGVTSDKDFESINDFESIVRSFKFVK